MLTQSRSSHLLAGSIVGVSILIAPLLFYTYECFPEVKIWKTFFITIDSQYYNSVKTFMWVFNQKAVFLYLLLIWYFTSRNWWRDAILAPIGMNVYQILTLINDEFRIKDFIAFDKYMILPLSIFACIILFFARKKLKFYVSALSLNDRIQEELDKLEEDVK